MKKRDLIEALKPLADDTEIVIVDGVPCRQFEYIDERFRLPLIKNNIVRLYGYKGDGKDGFIPPYHPKILGVDPLRAAEER